MQVSEMISTYPQVQGNTADALLRCIEECYGCAQTCTSCASRIGKAAAAVPTAARHELLALLAS